MRDNMKFLNNESAASESLCRSERTIQTVKGTHCDVSETVGTSDIITIPAEMSSSFLVPQPQRGPSAT